MQYATALEITAAYENLTQKEKKKLVRNAMGKIRGTSFAEPLDLIHETLARTYAGSRKWPLNVPFCLFMCLAMKSVTEADRSSNENTLVRLSFRESAFDRSATTPSKQPSIEDYLITLEKLASAAVAVDLARQKLANDQNALNALEGLLWGLSPRETCAKFALSEEDFDAARHRVSRRLREAGRSVVANTTRATRTPRETMQQTQEVGKKKPVSKSIAAATDRVPAPARAPKRRM